MTVQFASTGTTGTKFLPRSEAEAIPFSSQKVPEILARLSVDPDSVEAAEMAQTLRDCEAPAAKGEKKACATSLESMVDFATASLGTRHVRAVSTVVAKEGSPKQEYTVTGVERGRPGRGLPRGAVRVRRVRVPPDAADAGVLCVDARQGRHGRGRCRGVPRRHVRLEPQARRLPGAQREARHRAGLPLPAAGPRRLDPQRLSLLDGRRLLASRRLE
ncbi:BURP domain protein RD22 [Zea mays]|uniref:BURP domain protein RD22 n=1 Tax=Zea mays TaxID=4577 RepID=A0A1D6ND22_MAIZE|nr:BURP domain protein RD22 [Zea mays]